MPAWLKRLIPTTLKRSIRSIRFANDLLRNYLYDLRRYLKFSATLAPQESQERYQGRITAHYHVIEKGLSLKQPRVGFGIQVVNDLLSLLKGYQSEYGLDEVGQVALNTLFSYYTFNASHGHENPELLRQLNTLKETLSQEGPCISQGGVLSVSKEEIKAAAAINFRDFVYSRHSIRNFEPGSVDEQLIRGAVAIALKTPSVCNRQTWRVHLFSGEELKRKVLGFQNGNRGFGDTADKVLVVTSDLNYFLGANERNQCFIDGGMFAMSLVYALHSMGLGTCCLNWSVTYERDRALKQATGISDAESVIMMIAVGHLPEQFHVAQSSRRKVEEILTLHGQA